jgi:hypothetical protein
MSFEIENYTNYTLSDFTVYIADDALNDYPDETQEALDMLDAKLQEINELGLATSVLEELQEVPFFMEWASDEGAARFHTSEAWLTENGYIPEKVNSIEICNLKNFVDWTNQNQPFMVLHELSHAYHHRILGDDHEGILNAYQNAMENGLYDNVLYRNTLDGEQSYQKAYATTNEQEYFAELTEAFFGENEYYPFNYEDLESHDPDGYQLLTEIWEMEEDE